MKDTLNLYLLADGTQADPRDVSRGDDGVWRHKNGVGVQLDHDGEPLTLGAIAAQNKKDAEAAAQPAAEPEKVEGAQPEQKADDPEPKAT